MNCDKCGKRIDFKESNEGEYVKGIMKTLQPIDCNKEWVWCIDCWKEIEQANRIYKKKRDIKWMLDRYCVYYQGKCLPDLEKHYRVVIDIEGMVEAIYGNERAGADGETYKKEERKKP